jgi:hypothetical protein
VRQAQALPTDPAVFALLRERTEALGTVKPTPVTWQINLPGRLLLAQYAAGEASVAAMQHYVDSALGTEDSRRTLNAFQQEIVGTVQLRLGDALARAGRDSEARMHWTAAATRLRGLADATNFPSLAVLALCQARLHAVADAQRTAQRIAASAFRGPEYAEVIAAIAHGAQEAPSIAARTRP